MSMNLILTLVLLGGTAVVLGRSIELASLLSRKHWTGHTFQFAGFSLSVAVTSGGAMGTLFGWQYGPVLLLAGIAGWMLFDRRL